MAGSTQAQVGACTKDLEAVPTGGPAVGSILDPKAGYTRVLAADCTQVQVEGCTRDRVADYMQAQVEGCTKGPVVDCTPVPVVGSTLAHMAGTGLFNPLCHTFSPIYKLSE
jgi:hypothetical protein